MNFATFNEFVSLNIYLKPCVEGLEIGMIDDGDVLRNELMVAEKRGSLQVDQGGTIHF